MNPYFIALAVLSSVFGAATLGMWLRMSLPAHHLSEDTKDSVRIGMGLVATMAALILGLLVASAKGSYDTEKGEVIQMAAKITFLDAVLVNYGPESQALRQTLRQATEGAIIRIWAGTQPDNSPLDPSRIWSQTMPSMVQELAPTTEAQRTFKSQAAAVVSELGQMRWLLFEQADTAISRPLLIVVIAWLAIIMGSIGLFSPTNATAVGALLMASISVSGAIFLILELDQPFDGLIHISSKPMVNALRHLNGPGIEFKQTQ